MNKVIIALIFILCITADRAYCLRPPIITGERIKHVEVRALFERENKTLGGKGANDLITESLAEKLGFKTIPNTVRFTIQNIWGEFIKRNKLLVGKGNAIVEKAGGKITSEDIDKLRQLIEGFEFPRELEKSIEALTEHVQDNSIDRSSGLWEDSYERNLAGVFISLKQDDKKLRVKNIKKILYHALSVIWIDQNTAKRPMEGVPNTLSPEQGIGFLVQDFIDFDASGTAMSNLYGNTSIEVVVGDLELAVNAKSPYAKFPNIGKFIFPKDTAGETFEYDTPFSDYPHTFRIKEKVYSPEINPEERIEILRQYESSHGRINGKFSAISAEQAKRLNKVINALEAETGVPIDVEWGFKDNELYIVQRRPLIGDFPRVLVEKSAKFSEFSKINPAICRTSIALGHTSQQGFTGKIVLFGDIVNEKTIEALENELNAPYIRLQNDVASHVDGELNTYGLHTKAKVLVDVSMGSVQAHNVDLITDRISTGEFCYASGPVLRDSLDRHITFIPHPELRGVWVSLEDATYFGSGLKGEFYVSKDNKTPMPEINSRQFDLIEFHRAMQESSNSDIEHPLLDVLLQAESEPDLIPAIRHLIKAKNPDLEYVLRVAKDGKLKLSDIERVEFLYADKIQEALSYPLYPPSWESPVMNDLRKLLIFKGVSHKIRDRLTPVAIAGSAQKPESPKKLKVLFLENESYYQKMLKETSAVLGSEQYQCFFAETYSEANKILEANHIDTVMFHLTVNSEDPDDLFIFKGYLSHIPYIIGTTGAEELEFSHLLREEFKNIGNRIKAVYRPFSKDPIMNLARHFRYEQIKKYKHDLIQWQAAQPKKPERPEKLNILFLDDNRNMLRSIKDLSSKELSEEEYQGFFATDYDEACGIIESERIDAVVFDIGGRGSEIDINRFCVGLNRIPYVRVLSGANLGDMDTFVNNRLMSIKERVAVEQKPVKFSEIAGWMREYRKQQLEQYEQETHPPEKLRVLIIDDEIALLDSNAFKDQLGRAEYDIQIALDDPIDVLSESLVDVVMFDWSAVNHSEELRKKLLTMPHLILYSALTRNEIRNTPDAHELLERSDYVDKLMLDYDIGIKKLRELRQRQVEEWVASHPWYVEAISDRPLQKDVIFIVNPDHQEAKDLETAIKEKTGETREIVIVGSLWELERGLKQYKPSLVITDSELDGGYSLEDVTGLVKDKNPDVKFIVASEFAKTLPDYIRDDSSIRAIIEKPFYFKAVLNAM